LGGLGYWKKKGKPGGGERVETRKTGHGGGPGEVFGWGKPL